MKLTREQRTALQALPAERDSAGSVMTDAGAYDPHGQDGGGRMSIWYCVEELGDEWFKIEHDGPIKTYMAAEACADDFHHNYDGWECRGWPYVFALKEQEDGPVVVRYSVDREVMPQFTATTVP